MVHCSGSSSWTPPMVNITQIEVVGGTKTDNILILQRGRDREPIAFSGSGKIEVIIPSAEIKIERVSGTSPLTVYATTRESNGNPAPERYSLGTASADHG